MVKTRGLSRAREKWERRVAVAADDYVAGINAPRKDWQTETRGAEARWKEGVAKAAAEGRFATGVNKVSTADWQRAAAEKGAARWPEGVRQGTGAYEKGMKPILDAIEGVSLPQKFPKGDPRNIERVKAINAAVSAAARKK